MPTDDKRAARREEAKKFPVYFPVKDCPLLHRPDPATAWTWDGERDCLANGVFVNGREGELSFAVLTTLVERSVRRTAVKGSHRLSESDIADVGQEALRCLARKLQKIPPEPIRNLKSWIKWPIRWRMLDRIRDNVRKRPIRRQEALGGGGTLWELETATIEHLPNRASTPPDSAQVALVREALGSEGPLTPLERRTARAVWIDGAKQKTLAIEEGVTEQAISDRLKRAMRKVTAWALLRVERHRPRGRK